MNKHILIVIYAVILTFALATSAATRVSAPADNKQIEQEIRALYDEEHRLIVQRDVAAQELFYPDDFVVTNPFNMFIDRKQVMERIRADIIKYTPYERQ